MNSRYALSLKALGTWFGLGLVPFAPGTFGTLGAIPLVWFFQRFGEMQYMFAVLLFTVFSIFVAQLYEDEVAEGHDPGEFVLDEVVGFLVTMTWMPFTWAYLLAGFVLFRLFDILKPFPISWVDRRVPGGFGAVADDLLAGILASIAMQLILHFRLIEAWNL
jgi:phosphatidylglycerophosphatase A